MANIYNFCLLTETCQVCKCQEKGCTRGFLVTVYSDYYAMEFHLKVVMHWRPLEPGRRAGAEWDRAAGHCPAAAHPAAAYGPSANPGELLLCKRLSCKEMQFKLVCIAVKMYMPVIPLFPRKLLYELSKSCT